jgi:hypothetical protein
MNTKTHTLVSQLQKIWLRDTDSKIYLASITLWACTIKQLTEHTQVNRITVHDSVGRLIEKWLLLETYSNKRRLIFPQQISHLQYLVDTRKAEVDQLQHEVSSTIHLLQSLHLQSDHLPQIRISKWRQGINDMLSEISNKKPDSLLVISDSRHFDELISINFLNKLSKAKTKVQMILPTGFDHFIFSAHAKWVFIETRTLDSQDWRKWWMTLWWDTIALHAYEGIYITTTIIENPAIAQMMKCFFEKMYWK